MEIAEPTFYAVVLASAIMVWGTFRMAEWAFTEMGRKGKYRVIFWDQDARNYRIEFCAVKNGELQLGKGDKAKRFILESEAVMAGKYPGVLVNPVTGWNYRAPTKAETVDSDARLAVLSISNPSSYHKAMARNEWAEALSANDEAPSAWAKNAGLIAFAAVLIAAMVFGTVGFAIWAMSKSQGAA